MRRWQPYDTGEVDGVRFRVVPGVKKPGDLRMDWWLEGRWVPAPMSWGALLGDFFYDNEQFLYPPMPNNRLKGGEKYVLFVRHAGRHGWRSAMAGLRAEKAMREARTPSLFDNTAPGVEPGAAVGSRRYDSESDGTT